VEHYELLRLIGCGGMGIVFLARATRSGDQVALKLLRPELAVRLEATQLFLREIRLMRSLAHPHVLPILDFGETPERIWFTTPFLATESVAHRIDPAKPLPAETVLRVGKQVAQALQFAHEQKGIIHRDLKPANILLDAQGNAQLSDFGLARRLSGDSILGQSTEHRIGTAAYMSPAVASGSAWEIRDDIYALGAVLYEMLTGHPPYEGETHEAILQQIKSRPPRPMLELNRKCPSHLAAVVEAAMARTVRGRYASIADLAADLDRVAAGRAPLGPRGQGRSCYRWGAVPRREVAAVAGLLVLLVVAYAAFRHRPTLRVDRELPLPGSLTAVMPGDWDGDRRPELYTMDGNSCSIRSQENKPVHRPFVPANAPNLPADSGLKLDTELTLVGAWDVNRDGSADFLVHWWEDGELLSDGVRAGVAHAAAFNAVGLLLGHYSLSGTSVFYKGEKWHPSSLHPECLTNLTGGEGSDLIVGVCSGFSLRPRGIACFAATGLNEMRWPSMVEFASPPTEPAFADTNQDGRVDTLFVGTSAPDNTNNLTDGTDDAHAWLYAISATGQVLWRTNLADKYATIRPFVVQLNGKPLICTVVSRRLGYVENANVPDSPELPELGRITMFDASGHRVGERNLGIELHPGLAADLNGDGKDEVLVTDRLGRLHEFDAALRPVAKVQVVDPLLFADGDLTNLDSLVVKLKAAADPVSAHLVRSFSASSRRAVAAYPSPTLSSNELKHVLAGELSRLVRGPPLYDPNRFRLVTLRPAALALLDEQPGGPGLTSLNRLLLEDVYPRELSRSRWLALDLVGIAIMRQAGERMIVLSSQHVWFYYSLATLGNAYKLIRPEPHTHTVVHVLSANLRPVARRELEPIAPGRVPTFTTADWDGDHLQEIVAIESDRLSVLKLK
jgi:serine/threonine protein kinase